MFSFHIYTSWVTPITLKLQKAEVCKVNLSEITCYKKFSIYLHID